MSGTPERPGLASRLFRAFTSGPASGDQGAKEVRWFLWRIAKELRADVSANRLVTWRAGPYKAGYEAGVNDTIKLLYRESRK